MDSRLSRVRVRLISTWSPVESQPDSPFLLGALHLQGDRVKASLQYLPRFQDPSQHQNPAHQPGPSGLMARPDTSPVVAVEVFVKQDQTPPVRIRLKLLRPAKHGPPAVVIAQEDSRQP